MTLFRTEDPTEEPVTVAEAKVQLRIDHDGDDALIASLIKAAREEVESTTGNALMQQSWRLALDDWPRGGMVLIRRGPISQILSVTVFGADGAATVLPADAYVADTRTHPARLFFERPPAPGIAMNGIEIDFDAGYGEAATDVPDLLKRAIMLLVAHWYEFRAAFGAASQPASFPAGYERLVAAFRRRRF